MAPAGLIRAEGIVRARPDAVFAFLEDLERHWSLTDGAIEALAADGDGAIVQLRGPLGIRRTAHTRVDHAAPPRHLVGTARIGRRTVARVRWTLLPHGASTRVRLSASIEQATAIDRVVLALGGRHWLRRRFALALERLGETYSEAWSSGRTARTAAAVGPDQSRSGSAIIR